MARLSDSVPRIDPQPLRQPGFAALRGPLLAHRVISLLRSQFGRVWSEADISHRARFPKISAGLGGAQWQTSRMMLRLRRKPVI